MKTLIHILITVSTLLSTTIVMTTVALSPVSAYQAHAIPTGNIVFQWTPNVKDQTHYQLYRINADGSNLTPLTMDTYDNWFPSVSPNGSTIAFQSNRTGEWALFTISIDGRKY